MKRKFTSPVFSSNVTGFIKKHVIILMLTCLVLPFAAIAQTISASKNQTETGEKKGPVKKWSADPFNHQVFVENRGQFDKVLKTNDPVLFYAMVGGAKLYFTPKGVVYEYDEKIIDKRATEAEEKREEGAKKGEEKEKKGKEAEVRYKTVPHFMSSYWQGANAKVILSAEEEQTNYYTYGIDENRTIKANLFKKITYNNIYPGIDLVYTFPENRDEVKYAIIVHPGADVSLIKFKYSDDAVTHVDEKGNIITSSSDLKTHKLTEYAPVSFYQDGGDLKVNYALEDGAETFWVKEGYDKTKTLVIDPAINPGYTGTYDVPYDLDYDNAGNVYVYGAYNPHQLSMINPAGTVVWTFNTSTVNINHPGGGGTSAFEQDDYGGFCVDKVGQLAYVSEGFDQYGAAMLKVNSSGSLVSKFNGSNAMWEMWRMQYNRCTGEILVGGGGTNTPSGQVAQVNTTFSSLTSYDIYANSTGNSSVGKDISRMCIDPTGSPVYMDYVTSVTQIGLPPYANYDNTLLSVGIPIAGAGFAASIIDPTGQALLELGSNYYIGPGIDPNTGESVTSCGMNGMAAGPTYLYDWDGYTLRKLNKGTLGTIGTVAVAATLTGETKNYDYIGAGGPGLNFKESDIYWGGLAADACDNVYVGNVLKTGNAPQLLVYNSALALQSTTALPSYPYSVVLGVNDSIIYVCGGPDASSPYGSTGSGFVEAYVNSIKTVSTSANGVGTTCGLNNGSASASLSLCGTVQGAGVTYSWSPGGATTQSTTGLASGSYTVTMQIGCGNFYQAVANIAGSVPAPPTGVSASSNSPLCEGATLNLNGNATGATTWSWTGPNGFVSGAQNPTINNVTVANAGTYSLSASNACGTAATVTVNVTINTNPVVSISGSPSLTICSGTSVPLAASPSGLSTYAWTASNPGTITNTTYDTTTAYPNSTTTYTVIATDANGCSNSAAPATLIVNVNPTPTINVSGLPSLTVCSGGSVQLTASGAGVGGTYVWTDPSSTLTTTTYDTTTAFPSTTTTYTVVGTSTSNCSNATSPQTVVVTVNTTPTVSITPANPGMCPGDTANLTASGATTYTWNTGGTNDTIRPYPADTTKYYVVGANGGCTDTARVTLAVGVVHVIVTASSPVLCSGIPDTLTAKGANGYAWNNGSTNSVIIVNPTDTTKYWVVGTSGSGCSDTGKITIDVNTSPTVTATSTSPTSTVCPNDTTQAFVTVTGAGTPPYTYMWSNGQTHDTAYGLGAGSYTVVLTDANNCKSNTNAVVTITVQNIVVTATAPNSGNICSGGSTTLLTASGATNYIWRNSTGLTDTIYDTATASPTITTTYTVMGTTTGTCKDSATVVVTVNPTPTVVINAGSHDTAVCAGSSVVLNATGASGYTWSPTTGLNPTTGSPVTATPAVPTTYTVTGTTLGCPDTASVFVNVLPTPTVTISVSGGNDTVCPGASVTLTANGAPGNTYIWSPGGSTNSSITVIPLTSPSIYSVASYNGACTVNASQNIYIYPPLTISMIPIDSGCSGAPVVLGALVNGGNALPGYTYAWTPNIGTGAGPYTVPSSPATYSCTVTDGCGNTATGSTQVIINTSPVAAFTAIPNPAIAGQFVAFVDSSTLATKWYWTFGNGGTSTASFPYYTYDLAGSYVVTLWVTSSSGCRDSISDTVVVNELIFIPNVFTPNGDGINDVFHVTAPDAKIYNIEIFNRWGQRVFKSNAANIDWNGRSEGGVMCSDGTYYYEIQFTTYAGKDYKYTGYLQLIGGGGEIQQ